MKAILGLSSYGSAKVQKRDKQRNDVFESAEHPIMRYTSKDIDLRIILRDFESVTAPRPRLNASAIVRESKPNTVQRPIT